MSDKILQQIKSQFGVEVGIEETPNYYRVKGFSRRILEKDFSIVTNYDVVIPKQTGKIQVRNKEMVIYGDDNSIFGKAEFILLFKEFNRLQRWKKGTGRHPVGILEKDFNNQLIELLQSTEGNNMNQGVLLGILKEMNDKIISLQAEIRDMAEKVVPKSETDDILNVEEAMAFLGFKKSTIYTKVNRGEIPHMKRGKRLYFSVTELKKYLTDGKRLTNDEVNEMAKKYLNGD